MKKGFTLIELLVVIAIIGILASVVLASLNTARSEGENARDITNLNNARSQAELFYSTTGNSTYTTVCSAGTNNISALLPTGSTCASTATGWGAETPVDGGFYCVDSTGFGGEIGASSIDDTSGSEDVVCS